MALYNTLLWIVCFATAIYATCFEPSPAFPVPSWDNGRSDLSHGFETIQKGLQDVIADANYDTSSYSIEVTSNTETLWSSFHTARKLNETRPGDTSVDKDSLYRIASITKVFTTLGLLYQHAAGNLSLNSPISHHIPELSGEIPWSDITLRALASQISGLPRDFAQGDLINEFSDPTIIGLPPASRDGLPCCDEYAGFIPPCTRQDLIDLMSKLRPLLAPNQKSTYSNSGFDLLGLVIENVSGVNYTDYITQAILDLIGMDSSTFDTPADKHAVIPLGQNYFGIDAGVQNPTGGLYSSSSDMSKFARYVLTHYNAIATGVNWLMPASWAEGMQSFYGMPFEIFRSDAILQENKRPVTFATKSGGLPGYCTRMSILPEYGLGVTILTAGECDLLGELQEVVTIPLVQAAEDAIWQDVGETYAGDYAAVDTNLNSSLELTSSPLTGLIMKSFISNGTDVYNDVMPKYFVDSSRPWRAQLIPTLLYKNESAQQGEIWRVRPYYNRDDEPRGVWDEFCMTDIDGILYAGLPITEVVFWHEDGIVELPAWKLKMIRANKEEDVGLFVQQGAL